MWGPQSVMFTLSATCTGLAAGPFVGVQSEPQIPSRPSELPAYPVGQPPASSPQIGNTELEHLQQDARDPGHGVELGLSAVEF